MSVKDHIYPVLALPLQLIPDKWLIKPLPNAHFLPFYHLVSDDPPPHVKHLYSVIGFEDFKIQLDGLLKHFEAVSMKTLIQVVKSGEPPSKPMMHLTFDDGLKESVEIADILHKKGIPATFFLNTAFIGGKDAMYRYKASLIIETIETLIKEGKTSVLNERIFSGVGKDTLLEMNYSDSELLNDMMEQLELSSDFSGIYMDEQEIRKLIEQGFEIGGHSLDHPDFSQITLQEQKKQVKENMDFLESKFNMRHRTFAFPFTDYGVSRELLHWMRDEVKLDLIFGTAGLKMIEDNMLLQRFPMELYGMKNVSTEYFYFYLKQWFGKNQQIRKNLT